MTRPEIIRADTIDLQDHHAPSAKDHTRQPTHPAAIGAGPAAPHQAEAQREYAAEQAQYQNGAWEDNNQAGNNQYDIAEHAATDAAGNGNNYGQRHTLASQNGAVNNEDGDMADADDDSMDEDDMMDKISSSPSIDDGGLTLPPEWPSRSTSLAAASPLEPDPFMTYREPYQSSDDGSVPSSPPMLPFLSQDPGRTSSRRQVPRDLSRSESLLSMNSVLANNQGWEESSDATLQPGEVESYDGDFIQDYLEHQDPFASQDEWSDTDNESDDLYFSANMDPFLDDEDNPVDLPNESSSEADYEEYYDFPESTDTRYVDSGFAGECLQNLEDIDFEFVYALHTFVATVEGQANATKGDTMVLLDDSNSYWWLVRVVKDSSIGYLPAEHIETPTERLARLNKHRNIDLSASQLPDLEEKQKNSIVKALTKRKKNVTFNSVHNYVEASDVEYSSDEEEDSSFAYQQDHEESSEATDEITVSEPERAGVREVTDGDDADQNAVRASEDSFDGPGRSRNGTVRNTDSFFKDDTVETRKITITPNLLRDDSSTSTRPSVDSTVVAQGRVSLDKLQKDAPAADKSKDKKAGKDKKEKESKEKKGGMLSGLFKRKDKKRNLEDEDPEELIMGRKASKDSERTSSPEKMSLEVTTSNEDVQTRDRSGSSPQRHPSKLQKNRADVQKLQSVDEVKPLDTSQGSEQIRMVQSDAQDGGVAPLSLRQRGDSVTSNPGRASNDSVDSRSTTASSLSKILHRSRSNSEQKQNEPKLEKTKKSKERVSMDADSDSDVEEINHDRFVAPAMAAASASQAPAAAPAAERVLSPVNKHLQRPIPGAFPDSYASKASTDTMKRIEHGEDAYDAEQEKQYDERLSESPIEIFGNEQQREHEHYAKEGSRNPFANPPDLTSSLSEEESDAASPRSSPEPELIEVTDSHSGATVPAIETTGAGLGAAEKEKDTWSDASLREFFDDGEEVRDLLVVVYDKSGVEPAGADHPVVGGLFKGENKRLADMTNRLDNMLGDWLARKRSSGGPR